NTSEKDHLLKFGDGIPEYSLVVQRTSPAAPKTRSLIFTPKSTNIKSHRILNIEPALATVSENSSGKYTLTFIEDGQYAIRLEIVNVYDEVWYETRQVEIDSQAPSVSRLTWASQDPFAAQPFTFLSHEKLSAGNPS